MKSALLLAVTLSLLGCAVGTGQWAVGLYARGVAMAMR
jgi:hypothetical protein